MKSLMAKTPLLACWGLSMKSITGWKWKNKMEMTDRFARTFIIFSSLVEISCGDRTIRFLFITFSYERITASQAVYVDTFQLWSWVMNEQKMHSIHSSQNVHSRVNQTFVNNYCDPQLIAKKTKRFTALSQIGLRDVVHALISLWKVVGIIL